MKKKVLWCAGIVVLIALIILGVLRYVVLGLVIFKSLAFIKWVLGEFLNEDLVQGPHFIACMHLDVC